MASIHDMKKTDTSTGTSVPIQHNTQHQNAEWNYIREDGAQSRATPSEPDEPQALGVQMQCMGTQVKESITEYYEQGRESLED